MPEIQETEKACRDQSLQCRDCSLKRTDDCCATSYRGVGAIQAASKSTQPSWATFLHETYPFSHALQEEPDGGANLPAGKILALCRIVDCEYIGNAGKWGEPEKSFGYFYAGYYAYSLVDVWRLPVPIPVRGRPGLWKWEVPDWEEVLR